MIFHSSIVILIWLANVNNIFVYSNELANATFQETHDWQKIEEGQSIPAGLHVRINLQTGHKEAKLPEDNVEDSKHKKSLISMNDNDAESKSDTIINPEELKKILKNIKSDDTTEKDSTNSKFRSYDELKKEFNELNMQVKTDIEIIIGLIENFKKYDPTWSKSMDSQSEEEVDDEEILSTLVDLEYLVHQIDNAREFAKLNGFSEVIHKSLNSSNSEIRSEALRLHGSATQNNPKVQIAALDSGSINLLLKILTFDEDLTVRSRSLYAISCLLRQFPAAQLKFITDGGLTVFAAVFDEEKQDLLNLQVKIISLIHDLLFERKDTKMNILEEESKNQSDSKLTDLKEQLRQYQKIDLEKKLVEQNWCKRISNWFIKQGFMNGMEKLKSKDVNLKLSASDQHDVIEKTIDTLYVLSDICKTEFQSEKEFIELLLGLRDVYSDLALTEQNEKEGSSHFYSSLANILKILTEKLKGKVALKEEL